MYLFRKKSLFTLIFLATWLFSTFPFAVSAECSCCTNQECKCGCTEKNQLQENVSQDQPQGTRVPCIECDGAATSEPLSVEGYASQIGKVQLLSVPHIASFSPRPQCSNDASSCQCMSYPMSSPPLFLIHSTFLL
jgi:hypothetical protein